MKCVSVIAPNYLCSPIELPGKTRKSQVSASTEWPQFRLSQLLNILNVTAIESRSFLPQPVWAFVPTHPRPLSSEMPTSQRIRVKPALLRSVSCAAGRIIASPRMLGKQPLLIFQPLNSGFVANVSDLCRGSPLARPPRGRCNASFHVAGSDMTSVGSVRYYEWLLPSQPSCGAGLGPRLGSGEARLSYLNFFIYKI